MNRLVTILLAALTLVSIDAQAQKKELSEARGYIKSRADYDKAEQLMTGLLEKDAANRSNVKIYLTWFEAVQGQYAAANEKLYLKQAYDTVAFYNLIRRMQHVALAVDSLEAASPKGKPAHRKEHAEFLNQLRPNLYYGGTFLVRKGDYRQAFAFFDTYLKAAGEPLFEAYDYQHNDTRMATAAYWATLCGYKLNDAPLTLAYSQQALADSSKARFTLQYTCEAYHQQQDTPQYVATLTEGFSRFPDYPYFFPRLADYYTAQGRSDSVLVLANQGLQHNPEGKLFLLAKSVALLDMERYDSCIDVSKQLIALDAEQPEAHFNVATCYLNQALLVEQEHEPRKNRLRLQQLYTDAQPYMEKYRQLAPQDQKRWAPALYRIYLNLNMGKQFEEIDQLMRK